MIVLVVFCSPMVQMLMVAVAQVTTQMMIVHKQAAVGAANDERSVAKITRKRTFKFK